MTTFILFSITLVLVTTLNTARSLLLSPVASSSSSCQHGKTLLGHGLSTISITTPTTSSSGSSSFRCTCLRKKSTTILYSSYKDNNDDNNNNYSNYSNTYDNRNRRGNSRYDEELSQKAEINARMKSQNTGGGVGSTAAGAILGGLILGPFGALFGASIGNQMGMNSVVEKARKEELERMGITNDMLEQAREVGMLLDRSVEGLRAAEDSLVTQQRFAKRLEEDMDRFYKDAAVALQSGNEPRAKELLFKRTQVQDKLKKALMTCVEEKKRLEQMQQNVRAMEERALEIESLLKRSVGAKTVLDVNVNNRSSIDNYGANMGADWSLPPEDPLLKKFRDAGIE